MLLFFLVHFKLKVQSVLDDVYCVTHLDNKVYIGKTRREKQKWFLDCLQQAFSHTADRLLLGWTDIKWTSEAAS